jgi:hypothetical protein
LAAAITPRLPGGHTVNFRVVPGAASISLAAWLAASSNIESVMTRAYAVFWSGVAADTRSKLERLQVQPVAASRAGLGAAADQFAGVFRGGPVIRILEELDRYRDALRRFDADCELGVFDAGHADLANAAAAHGVVYKPCGAGGGDVGIALAAAEGSAFGAWI